jgi:hypothetical protein
MNLKTNRSERRKARRCLELKKVLRLTRMLGRVIPIEITARIEC